MKYKILFNHPLKGRIILSLSLTKSRYLTHACQKHWRCLCVFSPKSPYSCYVYNFDNLEGELHLYIAPSIRGGFSYYGRFIYYNGDIFEGKDGDSLELTVVSVIK